jgi:hypothetical protein
MNLLHDKVLRMALKSGRSCDKMLRDIFQDESVGLNGGIAESLIDHVSALPELFSGLEHEKVESPPTHPGQCVIKMRKRQKTRIQKYVHVLGHCRIGSVAVCGATLGEEIICGLQ